MRQLARRLLMILCALAFIGGGTISVALAIPCVHEHNGHRHIADHAQSHDGAPAHHDHHGAGCLGCCLAACTAMANLPPRQVIVVPAFAGMAVTWWEAAGLLSSRSIAPDPGPPRTLV